MLMLSAQQIRLRRITGKFTTSAETDPRASYRARGTAEGAPGPALRQCARRRPGHHARRRTCSHRLRHRHV